MEDASYESSPPRSGHIPRLKGFLPLSDESNPMAVHNSGALNSLIRTRSNTSLRRSGRSPSFTNDEEAGDRLSWRRDGEDSLFERRASSILFGPQMRSMRLIGNSNPRYKWKRYWKTEEELSLMKRPIREYYERTNSLIQQYIYIDRLLDSSLPHDLLNEYNTSRDYLGVPATITEEPSSINGEPGSRGEINGTSNAITKKIKRTPRDLYKVPSEDTPLLEDSEDEDGPRPEIPGITDDSVESGDKIVQVAIYVNLAANIILLGGKMAVILLTSSLSVLASLVDGALDLLSTVIVWTTTMLIARQDHYRYPVGRRRLEPIGVLVFSVVMVTSFFQVALESFSRLNSGDHSIIELGVPSISIMASTVAIKGLCWVFCRVIKNSSVQALAQDAATDVVFNLFSIIFPLVGFYANLWWLDGLGGLLLSFYVIFNWAGTSAGHIANLTGAAATADERNVLLYLTMRFAKTIKQIQGLQAYHSGDKLNVEVDIVLDETTSLRDSHDLGESLQYVLESVPTVDRAFVHQDYASWNLPSHMQQQAV